MYGQPTLIERGNLRFLLVDPLTNQIMATAIETLKQQKVKLFVRTEAKDYSEIQLNAANIEISEFIWDAKLPKKETLDDWVDLVKEKDEIIAVQDSEKGKFLIAVALVHLGAGIDETLNLVKGIEKNQAYFG